MSAKCAGLVLRSGGKYLLIKRVENGQWEQPGGHLEKGETPKDAAIREADEEVGPIPRAAVREVKRFQNADVDYTTFLSDVPSFTPRLSDEHTDWGWFAPGNLPDPMHPQVADTIAKLESARADAAVQPSTEMEAAKAIRDGVLASPQQYENCWLFALRITGTGVSYRAGLKEYVYRSPEEFLSDEFVERCNGLPVILDHPEGSLLNGKEFANRAVGSIILPYRQGDEVWGIAKLYDADAAEAMASGELSTSPAVRFGDSAEIRSMAIGEERLTIEGKPTLLDHLAVVPQGVWDKGGEPSGIRTDSTEIPPGDPPAAAMTQEVGIDNQQKEPAMAEENKADAADPARELMDKLDSICARMDALGSRMDAFESKGEKKEEEAEKKADAAEEEAEKDIKAAEKAGAEEEKDEKKAEEAETKADAAIVRANAEMAAQIRTMQAQIEALTKPVSYEERDQLAAAQARADAVAQLFGEHVEGPLPAESATSYRKRVLTRFQKHSDRFKNVRIDSLSGPVLDEVERVVYADAQAAALAPEALPAGVLIPVRSRDAAGREITRFHGDMDAWLGHFKTPGQSVRINTAMRSAN